MMRALGTSGLETPPVILGGNVFGWTIDEATSFAILDAFADGGGVMIDTADVYSAWVPGNSGGESETIIGRWLQRTPHAKSMLIATKVGMMGSLSPAAIAAACDASLSRLGIERIDLYYAHKDDAATPLAETMGAFDALVRAGKVRAIGVSNFEVGRVAEALAVSDADGLPRFSVLQPWFNLVERRKYEGALQDLCVENSIGVAPYYSLANGFLNGKYRTQGDLAKSVRGPRNSDYVGSERGHRVLAALDAIAADTGATLGQIALAWAAAQPGIVAPIASATSLEQVAELVGAMRLTLTPERLARLDKASA